MDTKFKKGDLVKWNAGGHNDNERIDKITKVLKDVFGSTQYMTEEVNHPIGATPKIGKAYEVYLTKA